MQKNEISISTEKKFTKEQIVALFHSVFHPVGWGKFSAGFPEKIMRCLDSSDMVFSAWDGDEIVGLLTSMSDTCYVIITKLFVRPEYQNRGVGTQLMEAFHNHYDNYDDCPYFLAMHPPKTFYAKFGYTVDGYSKRIGW